jgi:Baseplate J-like protein
MPLVLPNLDDRRWADLVEEGRALIPVYGGQWTDHNFHDPGITLMELLAWVAEMDIYQLNQIPDHNRRKFLELIDVVPEPPRAARTILSVSVANSAAPLSLPAGIEFAGNDLDAVETHFRTLAPLTVVAGGVAGIQSRAATGFHDLSVAWRRGDPVQPFGAAPVPGNEFYLALRSPLPVDAPVCLCLSFDGQSGWQERQRLECEAVAQQRTCSPPQDNPCQPTFAAPKTSPEPLPLPSSGVNLVWEFLAATASGNQWVALDPSKSQVADETRSFTLDGCVTFSIPATMAQQAVGALPTPWSYLRCRLASGLYDAPPLLSSITFNGVIAEQAVPTGSSFVIARGTVVTNSVSGPPKPGDITTLQLKLDTEGNITSLQFGNGKKTDPQFFISSYKAPTPTSAGTLGVEAIWLGFGDGIPEEEFMLRELGVQQCSFQLFTMEPSGWREWSLVQDFDACTWSDFAYRLDPSTGVVMFASGEATNVPSENSPIFVKYRATRADSGNLPARVVTRLADSPHNRALLYDATAVPDGLTKVQKQIASIINPRAAMGGTAAETVAHAAGRAVNLVQTTGRAVTLVDYETLAKQTPGARIARVKAWANLHPDFPCFAAPGMISVIVLPYLPQGHPMPSSTLKQAVTRYLQRRRIVGTRVVVTGPTYLQVAVNATVQSGAKVNKTALQQRIVNMLNQFLDPLLGGPDETGWPFGRDVYHAEIMQVIHRVPGVDHIISLALMAGGSCQPQCGNVCLSPTWLVEAGTHEIQVA